MLQDQQFKRQIIAFLIENNKRNAQHAANLRVP
jgi:hypothetical protein